MSDNKIEIKNSVNYYIEFQIDGVISSTEEEVEEVSKSLSELISHILKEKGLSSASVKINKFSDLDIAMSSLVYDETEH